MSAQSNGSTSQEVAVPRPHRSGTGWLAFLICGLCVTAALLSMQRTTDLELEVRELQARLMAAELRGLARSSNQQHQCHVGDGTPSEIPADGVPLSPDDLLEEDNLFNRVKACLAQHSGGGGEPPSAPGVNSTADLERGKHALTGAGIAMRVLVGTALVSTLVSATLMLRNLDSLPHWMTQVVRRVLRARPDAEVPLSKLAMYRLDRWFSINPYSKTLALLFLTVAMILVGGLGIFTLSSVSLDDALWEAVVGVGIDWTFPSDADPEDNDGSSVRVIAVRLMGLLVSLGGMLVTALMLGIVSEAIGDQMDSMRKGKCEVQETDHTLILGWSDKLYGLIKELANANESIGGGPIVILSERDKVEMQEDIADQNIDLRGSWIICRSGNPLLAADLYKVSVKTARSIVILAQTRGNVIDADVSDAFTLRIVMSLMSIHQNLSACDTCEGLKGHIVAEVCDIDNEPLLKMVAGSHPMETVVAHDVIGRLMIQSRRQPGLAAVWEDLLGFEGNEFYAQHWPELTGERFEDVLRSFPDAVPVGILQPETVNVILNPSDDYRLEKGDQVLVLAEDDDTYSPSKSHPINREQTLPPFAEIPIRERILFIGWRRDVDDMIEVLDEFVVPGSELWLYSNIPIEEREEMLRKGGLDVEHDLKNLQLVYDLPELLGEVTDRLSLAKLKPERFSSVLILGDTQGCDIADSDSRALATLLLIREIQSQHAQTMLGTFEKNLVDGASREGLATAKPWFHRLKSNFAVDNCIVISEILDSRTRQLINELQISEYVLSNEIISMALAMVSEFAPINKVLSELFTEVGNELYVHSAARYMSSDEPFLSFFELMTRARQRSEIVIGYKLYENIRPTLNPPRKSDRILSLSNVEVVVVIAEEDWVLEQALCQNSNQAITPRTMSRRQSRVARSSAGMSGRASPAGSQYSNCQADRTPRSSSPIPVRNFVDLCDAALGPLSGCLGKAVSKSSTRSSLEALPPHRDIPALPMPLPEQQSCRHSAT